MIRRIVPVFASLLLTASGCSQSLGIWQPTRGLSSGGSAARAALGRQAVAQTLYVGGDDAVAAYDVESYSLERTYPGQYVSAIAQDASGNLYVANYLAGTGVEFAAGSSRSLETITKGISEPSSIAFDPAGNVYIGNLDRDDVTVYSPSGTLIRTIVAGIGHPERLAFDSKGNLYVANIEGPVTEYDGGLKKRTRTISGTSQSFDILFDASDDLYVSNCSIRCKRPSIVEFGPQGKGALRTITDGLHNPISMALDSIGNLFVADANIGPGHHHCYVSAYAADQTNAFEEITDGVHDAQGVAVDASDNLYVMNYKGLCNGSADGSVTVYPSGSTGFTQKLTKSIVRPSAMIVGA
jgi:hypothetical protein